MALNPGTRVGPYMVVQPLGFGGMGEVYKARDDRLGRDVALKALPAEVAADPERLRRFEREARATGALNHPHLVTVFDFGVHEGSPFLVLELLEGDSLRTLLERGGLTSRRALELAAGIAEGLSAAHEKGVLHRDLKPENLFVTKDGRPKILDFGLAKLRLDRGTESDVDTVSRVTMPGAVLGTLAYMSPEQLEGREADARSDIFALGVVLYEMLSGRHPFLGNTMQSTVAAILTQAPPLLAPISNGPSALAERIVLRCLEKRPEARFQSARDLAFALQTLAAPATPAAAPRQARIEGRRLRPILAAALFAGLAGSFWLGRATLPRVEQEFHRLTFRRGDVRAARFASDGQTIVYSAAWGGGNFRLYTTRPDSPESRALDLPDAALLSASPTGEIAVCLGQTSHVVPGDHDCTLALAALAGGAARPLLEHVRSADFSPDGRDLAVVRRHAAGDRLEYPIGRSLVEGERIGHVRVSPSGEWVAFVRSGAPEPVLEVVRRDGSQRRVIAPSGVGPGFGIAWSADSREIWYTASDTGATHLSLYARDLNGRRRPLMALPGLANVLDLAPDGRALLSLGDLRADVVAWAPEDPRERLLSWLEFPRSLDLSHDGRTLFFSEGGQGAGRGSAAVYARDIAGSPAVRLGAGFAVDVSPDGRHVAALARSRGGPSRELLAIPTGPGAARTLYAGEIECHDARWFPGSDALLLAGRQPDELPRLWVLTEGSAPRPATPEGFDAGVPGPDGRSFVAQRIADRALVLFAAEGQAGQPLPGPPEPGFLEGWTRDGRSLLVVEPLLPGARILKRDLETGERTLLRELRPQDPTGIAQFRATVAASGDTFAAVYVRADTALFVLSGLR